VRFAPRKGCLSVEREGTVKRISTVLPIRVAVRSRVGSGRFSEGGFGGPGVAQPRTAQSVSESVKRV